MFNKLYMLILNYKMFVYSSLFIKIYLFVLFDFLSQENFQSLHCLIVNLILILKMPIYNSPWCVRPLYSYRLYTKFTHTINHNKKLLILSQTKIQIEYDFIRAANVILPLCSSLCKSYCLCQ